MIKNKIKAFEELINNATSEVEKSGKCADFIDDIKEIDTLTNIRTLLVDKHNTQPGNTLFLFLLGRVYHLGQGGPVNYPAAIALFDRAINLNHAKSMCYRAYMHEYSQGGPVNHAAAIALYDRAINLNHARSMFNRAFMHTTSKGGPVNYPAAIALYDRAIALNDANSMYNRASMHIFRQGDLLDPGKVSQLLLQYYQLQDKAKDKQIALDKIIALTKINIAKEKNNEVCFVLAMLYYFGNTFIKVDRKKALNWLKESQDTIKLFYNEIINKLTLATLSENNIKELYDFFQTANVLSQDQFIYLNFKIKLRLNNNHALKFYENENLRMEAYLTGFDYFHLGSAKAARIESYQDKQDKIKCIEKACRFFYKAYKKGDEASYRLLIQYLAIKDAICEDKKIAYESAIPNEEVLFKKFEHSLIKSVNKPLISELKAFIRVRSIEDAKKSFTLFRRNKIGEENELVNEIISALMDKKPLEEILKDHSLRNQIHKYPILDKFLQEYDQEYNANKMQDNRLKKAS